MNLSERLKLLLADSGKDQKEIACALGVSEGALSNYLKGRVPDLEVLRRMRDYFGMSVDVLLGWGEAKESVGTIITQAAALFASGLGRDEAEQQEVFNEYVILLSDVRLHAKSLVEKLDDLEAKTRFFAQRARTVATRDVSSKGPSEAQDVVLRAAGEKGGHQKSGSGR